MYVSSGAAVIALQEYYGSWVGYGSAAVSQTGSWKYARFYSQADYTNPRFRVMDYNAASTWYTDDLSLKQVLIRYPISDTNWHHVLITTATPVNTSDLKIGKGGARYMSGNIDEVKISSTVRSADWAKTEYNNQSNPATFYSIATEENVASPASNGGSAVTVYTATSNPGNITATSTGSPITVTGLTNGTEYTFTVTATNSAGTGPASLPSNPVTPATTPGSPTAVTPTAVDRQVSLLWSAPASNGGSAITDYVIEYKLTSAPDEPASWQIYADAQTPTIVATAVSGLANGTSYDFRISAVNAVGMGSSSSPLVSSIPKTIPGKTTITSVVPGDTQVTVNFDLLSNVTASNWYNNSWTYRKKITIDKTKVPNTNQTNFPVLVSLTGLSNINASGTDIRFTSSNGTTELAREIESYSNGTLVAWVKVPTLSTSVNTEIFMYYGNTSATEPAASATYGSRSVWSNSYAGVWHLKETGTNPQVFDSTINAKNSTAQTWTPTTGKIGGGGNFSATSITIPGSPISNVSNDWTFSGWMKPSSLIQNGFIFMNGIGGVGFGIGSSIANDLNGNRLRGVYELSAWAISSYVFSDTTTWHYVQMRRASGVTQFFIDGVLVTGTWNINSANYNYADSKIGGVRAFSGAIDEVTVSPIARSADWIKTEYNNQNNPSTFYSVASEETVTNSATNGGSEVTNYTVTSNPDSIVFSSSTSPIIVTSLTNGTPYTFTMTATNIVGQGPASNASSPVIPAGVPGIPSAVIATPGNAQVGLSWTVPSNNGAEITNYVIEYKLHSTSTWTQFGHAISPATNITVVDLVNGSLYDFRISAVNSTGTGSSSTPATESTPRTVPGKPTITGVVRGDGQVAVSFDAPASDGGSAITNYTVTSDPQGIVQTGNASPIIIAGLTNGTPYTFTVRATNVAGDGVASDPSSSVTPATVPGKATGAIATAGNGQATINFTAPLSNGGSAITGYTVYSNNGGTDSNASTTNLSHTVTGLTNGQTYTFTVVSINDVGTGSSSDASLPITLPTTPTAPLNVAAEVKSSSIKLTWSDPASTGGSAITDYIIEYQLTTGGNWVTFNDGVGIDKFTTVTGLSNDTSYDFRVSAKNIIGTSEVSSVVFATPGEPAQVFIQSFPDLTNTSIGTNVRITNEGSIEYEYQYDWCITDAVDNLCGGGNDIFSASNAKLIDNGDNYDFTATSTVPTPGNYYFHINVLYGSQSSSAHSSFSAVATFPDPPTGVSAVGGNAQAVVSFTIPASNGGSAISNYTVTSNPGGLTGTGSTTPITVTGLTNGTPYTFTMTATNVIGTGLSSSPPSNSVIPMTVPGAINSLSASAGNTQVGLFWTAPASNGGSAITDYVVEYKLSPDSSWTIFADAVSTATTIIVTGLTNNLSYDFRVSAVNAAGQGPVNSTSLSAGGSPSTPPSNNTSTSGSRSGSYLYPPVVTSINNSATSTTIPINPSVPVVTKYPKATPATKNIANKSQDVGASSTNNNTTSGATLNTQPGKNEVSATPKETSRIETPITQKQDEGDKAPSNNNESSNNTPQTWIVISATTAIILIGFVLFILQRRRYV